MAETRPKVFTTKCKSIKETNNNQHDTSQPCLWTFTARKLKDSNCFKITTWTPAHSCFATVSRNNNRALRSKVVVAHIQEQVLANLSLAVKQIQSLIKEKLNVDITYGMAWAARKKTVENIYGSWDENFHELPSNIMALQQANPGTVVQWLHHPYSSSDCSIFKYVFWAFRPSIEAFSFCIPIISIDVTHLRGTYKGKILMAVSKNANNMILPIAYAMVDEETNESWKWFLQQFAENIEDPARRTLCVISDRHACIKHAMDNLELWKQPHAYHRFCLRHVRSNFMAKFKSVSLKRMCWEIGSTTQERKYERLMNELKATNKEAWRFLRGIDKTKRTCSCGKWQIYRFPCSHAIAVCHHIRESPRKIVDPRFYTETYRAQYNNQYFPVPHKEDWMYAGWRIHGDPSKITIVRGRRRARRMHNEMDASYAEEGTGRRCSGCKTTGHRINNCPNRQN